jgi:hypothetical protein
MWAILLVGFLEGNRGTRTRNYGTICAVGKVCDGCAMRQEPEMNRMSFWIPAFAFLSLTFFILLVLLRIPFHLYPLMSYQDALDLLTPLVLIPVYWVLFKYAADEAPSLVEALAFLVLTACWVEGQGMHLAANSISNLIENLARGGSIDLTGDDIFRLTYFYDELLGHIVWHIGVLGLAALLIYREWRRPAGLVTAWRSTLLAGIIYGVLLFAITNEGNTVWLGLPFSALVTVFGLVWGRKKLSQQPVLAFFFVACVVALLIYTGWGLYWGGFPPIL